MKHLRVGWLLVIVMACAAIVLASPVGAFAATPSGAAADAQARTLAGEPDPTDPASDPGSLPFTGSPIAPVVLAGLVLMLTGLGVRRSRFRSAATRLPGAGS